MLTYAGFFVLAGAALLGGFFWYGMAFVSTPLGGAVVPLVEVAAIAPYFVLGVATERTIRELYGSWKAVRESGAHLLAIGALYMTSLALASGLDFDFSRSERRSMRAVSDALVGPISSRTDPTGEELVDQVALLRTCALFLRAEHPEGRAASSIGELAARYGSFRRADLSAFICERQNLKYFAHFEARDSLGAAMGYRLSYAGVPDRSGRLTDFEIVARPLVYGETGIRSYSVRSDGPIHVTLADRAATTSDAVVAACEYGEKWSTLPRYRSTARCARMPSVRPPAVALVHDSVARAGQSFTVGSEWSAHDQQQREFRRRVL